MTKHLLFLLPFVIWLAGCVEAPSEKDAAASQPAVTVSTVTANTETWPSIYEATGTVRARTSAVISVQLMAGAREVKVRTGDRVREGQLLVALDTRDLDISSRRAEAVHGTPVRMPIETG
jgi:multidrug efflux pump subunit AcrA (membrane-fusion protein)